MVICITKERHTAAVREVLEVLGKYGLTVWQAKEVLKAAKNSLLLCTPMQETAVQYKRFLDETPDESADIAGMEFHW